MGASIGIDLTYAATLLADGKLVAIPTETVYGLAANGLRETAVAGIFSAKNRPTFDPLILHVGSISQAKNLSSAWPKAAEILANAFWPGPLTLVLPKSQVVPNLVTADQPTLAIRMPNNAMTLALLNQIPFPLAAPSANPFGYVSPTNPQHVADQLGDRIDYILDGGHCSIGIESTIVAIDEQNQVTVLRLGGLPLEDITAVLGQPLRETLSMHSNPAAPGQLDQHYSPGCELLSVDADHIAKTMDSLLSEASSAKTGFLWPSKSCSNAFLSNLNGDLEARFHQLTHYHLSDEGDDKQAAMNLFGLLRQFDKDGCSRVYFTWFPTAGLGRAINDRLQRASTKTKG